MRRLLSRGALAWACLGVVLYACSGEERTFVDGGEGGEGAVGTGGTGGASGSSSGKGGTAGVSGSSSGGNSGTAGTDAGGEGGFGGEPEPPPPPGRPGTAIVAGGKWMQSTNYRLWVITGNGSLPTRSSSTNYRLHGGIVGTTQP